MANPKQKEKKCEEGSPDWMLTYGDMTTLLLTFFIALFTTATVDGKELQLILSAFQGSFGIMPGGKTLSPGELADMGNTIESLPARERGMAMAKAIKEALSIFKPEIKTKKVRVKEDERGIVISLSSDVFFHSGSAEINIGSARRVLDKVSQLLTSEDVKNRKIRIEGHTDTIPTEFDSAFSSNWELASGRSLNVLRYLEEYGVDSKRMSAASYGEYVPLMKNDTEEGRAYNRRVDIVILREEVIQ